MFKPSRKRLAELVYLRILDDVVIWNSMLYDMRNIPGHWAEDVIGIEAATGYRDRDCNRLARIGNYRRRKGWM
jgi:hypothetical protein